MSAQVRGPWKGWSGDTVIELTDGTIWQQAEYHYEYRYAYRPSASITNNLMSVDGMSRAVRVRRVSGAARLNVKGAWQGWKGHTVVVLTDGSRWEQAEYHYEYLYAHRPTVLLVGGTMQIEGMSRPIQVRRVR